MKGYTKKIVVYSLALSLFFPTLPVHAIEERIKAEDQSIESLITLSSDESEFTVLYEKSNEESKQLTQIADGTEVYALDRKDDFTHVQYEVLEENKLWIGYVKSDRLFSSEQNQNELVEDSESDSATKEQPKTTNPQIPSDSTETEEPTDDLPESIDEDSIVEETNPSVDTEDPIVEETGQNVDSENPIVEETGPNVDTENSIVEETEPSEDKQNSEKETVPASDAEKVEMGIGLPKEKSRTLLRTTVSRPELEGLVINDRTKIYESNSVNSKVLGKYNSGFLLKVSDFSSDWYVTNVNVDGTNRIGYILKSHVDQATTTPVKLEGVANKKRTNMYSSPSKTSKVLRVFDEGAILKFYTYASEWYRSSVSVNGKIKTIYIHKSDIEIPIANPVKLEGVSIKDETKMYALPSRSSQVLRVFNDGTILKFYTYSNEWYKSSVTVNGKIRTIYIHKSDIELPEANPVKREGVALKGPTNMYSAPTRDSSIIRSYHSGFLLRYYTFTSEWYRSSVNLNGKMKTIYIHKSDVDPLTSNVEKHEGIALKQPTHMYSSPTRSSKVLRAFNAGTILKYYYYSSGWYRSNVYVDGKYQTIYINKDDIEQANPSSFSQQGIALKSLTRIYLQPSIGSKVPWSYRKGSLLKYYNYSDNWYRSYARINGKVETIYLKKTDVGTQYQTFYNITLNQAVKLQMQASPLTDSRINAISFGLTWNPATESQIKYYLNPLNFSPTSDESLQFLILSVPANTSAIEVNEKILKGKGVLAKRGNAFIDAARTYNINEVYLISHSLLETGNGSSALAKGIEVNGVTVYNMYGVGAYDSDPNYYGALFAYEQGWTSVEKAIVGGAKFVSVNYIHNGQDTLYKMRWNPEGMAYYGLASHQYASDIGWAVKQTDKMGNIYNILTQYSLLYDVPVYR